MDVINSPKFLTTNPKTLEAIFKLDALNITSEMQLINALERYIKHNQEDDDDIGEKVRPALSHIRFLTLSPTLVSQTTLLDPEDVLKVIGCLPPDGEASKMPTFLSLNNKKRGFSSLDMEMVRQLSEVYSSRLCFHCGTYAHKIWTCTAAMDPARRTALKNIYEKYNHVWLLEYDRDDLKAIYEMYKTSKWVS